MENPFPGARLFYRSEAALVVFTSLQALFLGAFVALFTIGSQVLFLQSWEATLLPKAFVVSGVFGLLLFSGYSYLVSRTRFRTLVVLTLGLTAGAGLLLFLFYDPVIQWKLFGIPLMLPFTLSIPVVSLMLVLFRRMLRYSFSPDQHRRLAPAVRNSLMAGIIIASYAIVAALFIHWDILLTILAGTGCIAMTALIQLAMGVSKKQTTAVPSTRKVSPLRSRFYELFYSRYTLLLLLFVVLSSLAGFMIHYQFLSETSLNYDNTIGLAKFLGFFTGTMSIFVYGVEKFLVRKILYSYDSPYSLILIPSALFLASVAALVVNLLVGNSAAFARFSFGFLMVAMLRIGYETAFESIELPSLRVLFRTLDIRFSNIIIARMEGTFRMLALALAGVVLSAMIYLGFARILHFYLLLLLVLLLWLPVGFFLVKSYQKALHDTIRKLKTSKRAIEQDLLNTDEKTHGLINGKNPVKTIQTLNLVEKLEPLTHENHILSLLNTSSAEISQYLFKRIEENGLLSSLPRLRDLEKSVHGRHLSHLISRFEIKIKVGTTRQSVENLLNSNTITDRILAAEIIGNSGMENWSDLLLHLSRDIEPEVKLASVKSMARLASPDFSYILIGYLTTPVYYPYAFEALVKIGDPALPLLEQTFLLPDSDYLILSRIVRIYGKIGSPSAIDLLLTKIENQNRTILRHSILALREAKFQASPATINRVLNDIVRLINTMSWNFSAYSGIQKNRKLRLLSEALEDEIADNYNTLYHLLALAYNATSIGNIRNMLTEGSDTDISFAIEILDQVVNEEIKQVFLPVIENISVKERYKQLQYFFQAPKQTAQELILDILTRDYNAISLYAKACATFSLLEQPRKQVHPELIACLFHPNLLIRESAAYVIEKIEPGFLESVYPRLDPVIANELRISITCAAGDLPYLMLQRITFLSDCEKLHHLSKDVLAEIARSLEIHSMEPGEEFLIKKDDVHYAFIIIIRGEVRVTNSGGLFNTFGKNDVIYSDIFAEDQTFSFKALTDLKFFSIEQEMFNALMFDYVDFRTSVLEIVEEA